jgi:4-hydroxythreonine-4-phosphate dehydrogenase
MKDTVMKNTLMNRPLIALTQGDPAGIGPEIIVSAWSDPQLHALCRPLVIGNVEVIRRAAALIGAPLEVVSIKDPNELEGTSAVLGCLSAGSRDAADVEPGKVDPRGGQAAYDALVAATELALDRAVDAVVTGPLNKAALNAAGHHFPGHTELLGELCSVDDVAMMLYLQPRPDMFGPAGLGVVHATLHMSVADAVRNLRSDRITTCARLAHQALSRLGEGRLTGSPRIAVCALNPHAGEDGLFGTEELEVIAPAVRACHAAGLAVHGPLPADALMVQARDGQFDAVVAMYHDQGHIALKLLGMHQAVNVTLGLPIVRTSVAHGTAFDLAWQGKAETTGLFEAVRVAVRMVNAESESAAETATLSG